MTPKPQSHLYAIRHDRRALRAMVGVLMSAGHKVPFGLSPTASLFRPPTKAKIVHPVKSSSFTLCCPEISFDRRKHPLSMSIFIRARREYSLILTISHRLKKRHFQCFFHNLISGQSLSTISIYSTIRRILQPTYSPP